MLFIAIMFLTTACVAGAAAFFSVYGLAHTFEAAFWSVVFMGGSLEAGKLMITSYLYRFRETMTWGRKSLGIFFVFGLMMVTSLGIYGYLADAYQAGSTGKKQVDASMTLKREEQANLQKRKTEIDDQIAKVPDADTRGKQRLITQFGGEVNTINKRLIELTAEIQQDAQKQITTDSHVGPIVFIAKILGLDPDKAMSYFILMIIFLFDPVAVYLTVATNEAIAKYKRKEEQPVEYGPSEEMDEVFREMRENYSLDDTRAAFSNVPRRTLPESTDEFVEVPEVDPSDEDRVGVDDAKLDIDKLMEAMTTWETLDPESEALNAAAIDAIDTHEVKHELALEPLPDLERFQKKVADELHIPEEYLIGVTGTTPVAEPEIYVPYIPEQLEETLPSGIESTFQGHPVDDVELEAETQPFESPIKEIEDIYDDLTSKDNPTPLDEESRKLIERFFARQNLVKNVRTGNIDQ